MIINGGSRAGAAFFSRHLMRADENERVNLVEIRGLAAENVRDAFSEMEAVASGTRVQNYFYHANINTRADEQLTAEQWEKATDTLERELGLTGQPRFVVEHEKEGRTHRHVVWSRVDADSMTAIPDSLTYRKHELAAREIEREFGLEPVESVLVKNRESERPERRPQDWESFRAADSKIDPQAMKAEVTALWQAADTGLAFKASLEDAGYILAKGDRRDFCIVDRAGDEHSLARRISGVKASEIRARMSDVDSDSLPSVADARELAREAASSAGGVAPREPLQIGHDGGEPAQEPDRAHLQPWAEPSYDGLVALAEPSQARGELRRTSSWGDSWRTFSDRARAFSAALHDLWDDETSGVPESERGYAARLVDAGRKLLSGNAHRDGATFREGIKEAAAIARDLAGDETGGVPTGQDGHKTWADYVRDHIPRLLRDVTGSGPGIGFSNPQEEMDRMADEWAEGQWFEDPSPEQLPEEPEPDTDYGHDGPDIE